MKNTYLVWKDPACNGINPEWEKLSRKEFFTLIKSPEGSKRRFVKLGRTNNDGSDGKIIIEATEHEYKEWLKEKRHKQHLRDSDPGYTLISYHAMEGEEEDCYGEELLADPESKFENSSIDKILLESLSLAMKELSADELWLIDMIYWKEKGQPEIAKMLGITQQAVSKRLNKILAKLKNQID